MALVALGIAMLVLGIVYHVQFMLGLRKERQAMTEAGLIHGESAFPRVADADHRCLLLLIGILAIVSMLFGGTVRLAGRPSGGSGISVSRRFTQ